ncbi:MAG: hypothetical protein QUU85_04475, partial [Candidatus Eisenbacteria bacterium]|nr:hypothetical protein [Candidatus Eisenbacteria bacterium]
MTSRQPRDRRRAGCTARLTERDRAVLLAVNRLRLAWTGDVLAFAFGLVRRDTALRRLRRLYDAGYLDVIAG